jgi:hypothetical protein
MDTKALIVFNVRQIDRLQVELTELWSKIQKSVADGLVDDAISFLNRYFSLRSELERVEANLIGALKGQFSDK